jgi:argonaute-like protein implicated in RNA metabolism and viral defense
MCAESLCEITKQIYESEFRLSESFRREEGRMLCEKDFIDGVLIIEIKDGYEIISNHTSLRTKIVKEMVWDDNGKKSVIYLISSDFIGSHTQPVWEDEMKIQRTFETLRPIIRRIKLNQLGI